MSDYSPICEVCTGWLEEVTIDGKLWLKCRSCSFTKEFPKKIIRQIKETEMQGPGIGDTDDFNAV